jgi:hypothetical protein
LGVCNHIYIYIGISAKEGVEGRKIASMRMLKDKKVTIGRVFAIYKQIIDKMN